MQNKVDRKSLFFDLAQWRFFLTRFLDADQAKGRQNKKFQGQKKASWHGKPISQNIEKNV